MQNYNLIFTKKSAKDIKKIDILVQRKIKEFFSAFKKNPFKYSKKLKYEKSGQYRAKFKNYRIIFDIDKNKIIILRIGHRKDIYF
ncbi:MAG: type II toxin-antitoxin system RelE/ParE family toxin [Armatimonadota bacterium]